MPINLFMLGAQPVECGYPFTVWVLCGLNLTAGADMAFYFYSIKPSSQIVRLLPESLPGAGAACITNPVSKFSRQNARSC